MTRTKVDVAAEQVGRALRVASVDASYVTEHSAVLPGVLTFGVDLGMGSDLYIAVYDGGEWRYGVIQVDRNPQTGRRLARKSIALANDPAIIAMAAKMAIDQAKAQA